MLSLTDQGEIVASDSLGGTLWKMNSSKNIAGGGTRSSATVLLNTGNLVIRSFDGTIMWENFDRPTDTFLPGMKIWDKNYSYLMISTSYSSTSVRFVLDSSGKVQFLSWDPGHSLWAVQYILSVQGCGRYGSCGPYGHCDLTGVHTCKCLDGFEPVSDKFVYISGISFEECTVLCSRNCSCTAYAYTNSTSLLPPQCLLWMGELIDTAKLGENDDARKFSNADARKSMLDWPTRFKTIKGVAKGLLYLHQDSRLTVVHRDLKASNKLLDADMSPKVSDFGMAMIFGSAQQQANTNRLVGTYGYMSPEYALEGTCSVKSYISFGVLLLKIVSGLKISHPHRITDFLNLIAFLSTEDGSEPGWLSHGSIHLCASDNRLVPGKPISPGSTIISDDGTFALGFFSPSNPKKHYYVGIWYNNIPKFTVVWVANRAAPITVPSSAVFTLTRSSNLTLSDGNGHVLWTTMAKSRISISSPRNTKNISTEAMLDNTGNLILRSLADNAIIWQSFDHPTDTLLPGMNLRLSHNTHPLQRLISWKDIRDPSPGPFSYGADPNNLLQRFIWHGSVPHRRSPVWNNYLLIGKYMNNLNSTIYMAINHDSDEVYMSFGMPTGPFSVLIRMKITYLGKVNMLGWQSNISAWTTLYSEPVHDCNIYGYCGPNSYCDNTDAVPACKCLDGFEPREEERRTNNRSFLLGCRRRKALRCHHGNSFLTYPSMKVPDNFIYIHKRSFDECMVECRSNCSCVAYAYSNISSGIIDDTRCLLWTGELIDMEKVTQGGENLYIRANRLNGNRKTTDILEFVLPAVASLLILICMLIWICGVRGKQRGDEIYGGLMLGDISTSRELSDRKVDFPIFSFREIASATNNFSDSNILGHGGFGTVYKGTMDGDKEIAVKRLSKGSAQDASRNSALDWTTRFKIIKGVARGILYLHQDSRLTIIHRDLKASNVLLDADMHPKISDFGTARIFGGNEQQSNTNRVVGTYGYMAPEYALEGIISVKSDVYSFGVLLLEIVSGLKISGIIDPTTGHSNLIAYAWSLWKNGNMSTFVDASISESSSLNEALRCIHIALLSIQNNPNARPLMSWVVSSLDNKDIELPEPKEPMYFAHRSYGADGAGESFVNDMSIASVEAR
ncbi:hypothetical protein OsJ_26255 [Oryza sativa Japonica Group]|uniref:non-specific serine/threonine protein kinase n=1 Tax=Oryza sativa subsp. japonica TaxID=39947 RepID=B9FZD1_ORYSJ|nr:hypothetical protein OsJ_26255 [Oryza sativa Japonica Group]